MGEPFSAAFGGRPAGRILSVEPGVQLTGMIMGAAMSYVLVPLPDGSGATRLLLKVAARGRPALAPLLCAGDLVMARRQLRTLARLAEARPRTATATRAGSASAHPQQASMTATATEAGTAAQRAGPRSTRTAASMLPR